MLSRKEQQQSRPHTNLISIFILFFHSFFSSASKISENRDSVFFSLCTKSPFMMDTYMYLDETPQHTSTVGNSASLEAYSTKHCIQFNSDRLLVYGFLFIIYTNILIQLFRLPFHIVVLFAFPFCIVYGAFLLAALFQLDLSQRKIYIFNRIQFQHHLPLTYRLYYRFYIFLSFSVFEFFFARCFTFATIVRCSLKSDLECVYFSWENVLNITALFEYNLPINYI